MISLYRDPEGKNVFSYIDSNTQTDQLSKVMSYNADCTGCQHLQTKVNMLEVSIVALSESHILKPKCYNQRALVIEGFVNRHAFY